MKNILFQFFSFTMFNLRHIDSFVIIFVDKNLIHCNKRKAAFKFFLIFNLLEYS
jgi:hypothetical protein